MAEVAAPALPATTLDMISTRAAAQYAEWKANATAEQKEEGWKMIEKFKNDEDFRNQRMAGM